MMFALKPPKGVLVIVAIPLEPSAKVTAVPERLKPEVGAEFASAFNSPAFGLPHPVTRSYPVTAE